MKRTGFFRTLALIRRGFAWLLSLAGAGTIALALVSFISSIFTPVDSGISMLVMGAFVFALGQLVLLLDTAVHQLEALAASNKSLSTTLRYLQKEGVDSDDVKEGYLEAESDLFDTYPAESGVGLRRSNA